MNEFDFIDRFLRPLSKSDGAAALRDDVARLPDFAGPVIVTTDTMIEGVHFRKNDPWDSVGRKLVRVNVSDCLAKGAQPRACLLNLSWSREWSFSDAGLMVEGLARDMADFGIELLGGDTTVGPGPVVLSLTMFADCISPEGPIRRKGAQVGDDIWVTGYIGDSYLGLSVPERAEASDDAHYLDDAYLVPNLPPVAVAELIARHANASMDISDGLLGDAGHLAAASDVELFIDLPAMPVSVQAQRYLGGPLTEEDRLKLASGGDDYQVLFTASVSSRKAIEAFASDHAMKVTRIGICLEGQGVSGVGIDGMNTETLSDGWQHKLKD